MTAASDSLVPRVFEQVGVHDVDNIVIIGPRIVANFAILEHYQTGPLQSIKSGKRYWRIWLNSGLKDNP